MKPIDRIGSQAPYRENLDSINSLENTASQISQNTADKLKKRVDIANIDAMYISYGRTDIYIFGYLVKCIRKFVTKL